MSRSEDNCACCQPLLDAKDAEIARLKETRIYTDNSKAAALLQAENTTLKAVIEQAREGLEKIENDLIGLGAQDELTHQYPDKAGSLDWIYRYTRDTLTAINAATGKGE